MKLMRSVGRNVNCIAGARSSRLSSKSGLQFALEQNKSLLEIMAMRRRAAARRNVHVNEAKLTCSIGSR